MVQIPAPRGSKNRPSPSPSPDPSYPSRKTPSPEPGRKSPDHSGRKSPDTSGRKSPDSAGTPGNRPHSKKEQLDPRGGSRLRDIQILFDVEHCKKYGRDREGTDEVDIYAEACDAVIQSLSDMLDDVGETNFGFIVNKRPRPAFPPSGAPVDRICGELELPDDWVDPHPYPAADAEEPKDVKDDSPGRTSLNMGPGDFQPTAPKGLRSRPAGQQRATGRLSPQRQRVTHTSKYPRAGSFEITGYDMVSHDAYIIFSKYKAHSLPTWERDLHNGFFSFMAQYAVRNEKKVLLAKIATMSSAFGEKVNLPVAKSDQEQAGGNLVKALSDVRESIMQGRIDVIRTALDAAAEFGMQTKDTLDAQTRLFQLESARDRLKDALEFEEAQDAEEAFKKCRDLGLEDPLLDTAEDKIYTLIVRGGGISRRPSKEARPTLVKRQSKNMSITTRPSLTAVVDDHVNELKARDSKRAAEVAGLKEAVTAHAAKAVVASANSYALAVKLEASETALTEAEQTIAALRLEIAALKAGGAVLKQIDEGVAHSSPVFAGKKSPPDEEKQATVFRAGGDVLKQIDEGVAHNSPQFVAGKESPPDEEKKATIKFDDVGYEIL